MPGLSPRTQLIACLALAGAGLALFFSGEYRDLDLPLGWVGSLLFVAAVWFCVDAVQRIPRSEAEGEIAPGEWQAWVGVAFLGAVIVAMLASLDVFAAHVPIRLNPDAGDVGRRIGTLFVAWLVLAHVLKQRWAGKVQEDERDARVRLVAGQCARTVTVVLVIGIAVTLGFSDTARLSGFSYPYIAQLLMLALLVGGWVEQVVAAWLYWRDRRAVA